MLDIQDETKEKKWIIVNPAFLRIGISQVCKFARLDLELKLKNPGIFQNILDRTRSFVCKWCAWSCDTLLTASYDHRKWTRCKTNFDMRKINLKILHIHYFVVKRGFKHKKYKIHYFKENTKIYQKSFWGGQWFGDFCSSRPGLVPNPVKKGTTVHKKVHWN